MARLLRVHFSSIGHKDARLAPLTLDLRHGGEEHDGGTGADTVIWLRNGGGKSSILNLFYSVFRPNAREFLGSSAEGKARRLEQYVKGRDLAFVITEWDVEAADDLALFAQAPVRTRIVGQMLGWKNQRVSADASNLRRLFFSLSTRPGAVEFDSLPVFGLGEPADSFDGFRDWLRDVQHRVSGVEVVSTDHQQKWQTHLEQIGLDPELFRYQLAMNQREGAADEVFRFRRDDEFIQFLLELAFDPRTANQIAANLQAQRDNLRERPRWELEHRFVGEALEVVRPLAVAAEEFAQASRSLEETTRRTAATVTALELQALEFGRAADEARLEAEEAKERARRADNERTKKLRWARGLQRLALQFDEAEAREEVSEAEGLLAEASRSRAVAEAARHLRGLRTIELAISDLREALARAEAEIEPLRRAACERGSLLQAVLEQERERVEQLVEQLRRLENAAEQAETNAHEQERVARERAARCTTELEHLDDRIARRERARERLLEAGWLERREAASDGLARWQEKVVTIAAAREHAESEREAVGTRANELRDRTTTVTAERAGHAARSKDLSRRLEQAYAWRDRLRSDPRILEVEGVDEASLESPGLEARLRHRADVARRRGYDSRVEGAQDQRSLEWMREHGLLPSPLDVQRVVSALQEWGIAAHAGPEYLEQNAPSEQRRALMLGEPARFSGVIVLEEASLDAAARLDVEGLGTPVMISVIEALTPAASPSSAVVLAPDAALYDATVADERRPQLERAVERRDEEQRRLAEEEEVFRKISGEVARFVHEHGSGKLDALDREHQAARQQAALADAELRRIAEEQAALGQTRKDLDARIASLGDEHRTSEKAVAAIEQFIETHDAEIDAVRIRKDEAVRELGEAKAEAQRAHLDAAQHRERAKEHQQRRIEQSARSQQLATERDAVTLVGEPCSAPPQLTIEAARASYETARKQYDREIKADRLQAQLEEKNERRAEAKAEYDRASRDLDPEEIERLHTRPDLDDEQHRLKDAEREQIQALADARAHHKEAKAKLDEANRRRREAEDLPAEVGRPADAGSARRQAAQLEAQAEHDAEEHRGALVQQQHHREQAEEHDTRSRRSAGYADGLRSVAQGAHIELPEVRPAALEPDPERLDQTIITLKEAFTTSKRARERAEQAVHGHADAVRRVANRSRYVELRARYQERMKESTEELVAGVATLASELDVRLQVIEQTIDRLDEDRRLIVEELLHVADQVTRLLQRAESSSRLPSTIEGWAGRPYLRVKFKLPETDEDKRSVLAPMVDRLVEQAQIPGGIELVFRTAQELAGARGFDVQILKPDAEPRPDPIPIHQMSTFSRGQQLTAAILLYCTLVQLRARTRGRAHGAQDAGVLILDNPIGTCSNVALLQLQRTIASQMRVQLVYTTGVDDLEALETLPNKIRLRNTHRDRSTGDYHVTDDDAEGGSVEGVRVVEVPPR